MGDAFLLPWFWSIAHFEGVFTLFEKSRGAMKIVVLYILIYYCPIYPSK